MKEPESSKNNQDPELASTGVPLSIFTVTLNEEANLARMLSSVQSLDCEKLIVDCGSTDRTLEIASQFGARVISHPWQGYAKQKQYALEQCANDWCLCLDADEAVTPEMAARIPQLISDKSVVAWRFGRKDSFAGSIAPESLHQQGGTRLFRKSRCRFDVSRTVHEKMIIDGPLQKVGVSFLHYGYGDLKTLTEKNNIYSGLKAQEKAKKSPRPSLLRLIFSGPVKFLQFYIVQRNFLWGWRGFVRAVTTAYYGFSIEAKRYEIAAQAKKERATPPGEDKT